ncbi:unnamed protein product [Arctogadus glacialis]
MQCSTRRKHELVPTRRKTRAGSPQISTARGDQEAQMFLQMCADTGSISVGASQSADGLARRLREALPVWMRLAAALLGLLFPREAMVPPRAEPR